MNVVTKMVSVLVLLLLANAAAAAEYEAPTDRSAKVSLGATRSSP